MNKIEEVKTLIKTNIPDATVQAYDMAGNMDNLHLELIVASDTFKGKTILEQHKMVMSIIRSKIDDVFLHAVQLKTMTLEKYNETKGKNL